MEGSFSMASRTKDLKTEKNATGNEKYLNGIFTMMKNIDNLSIADKSTRFNSTEMRMIGEIMASRYVGKRLISTQLAQLLGITRSAVSQIVNRLEEQRILKRVADEVDRKIAYIEITDETMDSYRADIKTCSDFVGKVVEKFGEEKFQQMKNLLEEFMDKMEEERQVFTSSLQEKKKLK